MNRLFEKMMVPCIMLDRKRTPDGQGGWTNEWTEGAPFNASIVKDSTLAARVAEKQGVTEVYTITTDKSLGLEFHDVFKRVEDGAVFRITSNAKDSTTPDFASFQFGQVSAERWELQA